MKVAFIFPSKFNVLTVFSEPLGGSESAVTYLSIELSKLGHEITLFTLANDSVNKYGVRCCPLKLNNNELIITEELAENYDVIIFKNGLLSLAPHLKILYKNNPKMFFWTGHAHDQPAIAELNEPNIVKVFDAIICVSN
ncbi:MAG: hypothetical protein KC414_11925, partial [Romboutsia sp.]|nr:hypothetical protein [Romboutsia sp.]